ncbi:MAG: hypothetical protein ACTHMZ_09290 [Actinomycetes bacterium]
MRTPVLDAGPARRSSGIPPRAARPVATLVAVVATAMACLLADNLDGFRHSGWTGTPDLVQLCGRDYAHPHSVTGDAEQVARGAVRVGMVPVRLGEAPAYAASTAGEAGCGTVVWVDLGGRIVAYTLLGSP